VTPTAVILNWRTPDLTLRAARALIADGVPEARLVIVDNASGDGSAGRIRAELPAATVVETAENLGFARANNVGARALPGSAYAFVNSDAFVRRGGTVARLLGALDDPAVGIAIPRLRNEDGSLQPTVVPLSSPLPEAVRASGLSRWVPNRLQPALGTHWDHGTTRDIHAAIGPVLVVRGALWDALGGFDEHSFMYAEDLDLFRRARRLGWRSRFVAEAEFTHLGGASAEQRWSTPERAERVAAAEAAMVVEHLGRARGWLTVLIMCAGVGGRALALRLAGRRDAAAGQAGWLRGYLRGARGLRTPPAAS
jgi:N-acetylglucosaminyl-diphospho-decaprenol L-rhamnosyltransferase